MKKLILPILIAFVLGSANAQSVSMCPLQTISSNEYARLYAAPEHNVLWIGMDDNSKHYSKTLDAGNTFDSGTIPEPASRGIVCMAAIDGQTAWAGMTDFMGSNGGAIWKTTNGGNSWIKQTNNNEFAGGFLDNLYFFTPDSGVAFGDPNGGYYEIYTTVDGGSNWNRVAQSNVPAGLGGEYGLYGNSFCTTQNGIWCLTDHGRVYFSNDRGYHWQVSLIANGVSGATAAISMTDPLNGAACEIPWAPSIYLTNDGGITWTLQSIPVAATINRVSAIKNTPGAFVISDPFAGIFATTDNFVTTYPITTNSNPLSGWTLLMYDATIGWTNPINTITDSALIKISNAVTGINDGNTLSNLSSLNILPNPVEVGYALVSYSLKTIADVTITLYDVSGKVIKHQNEKGKAGNNAMVFDFKNIQTGLYLLKLENGNQSSVTKVIVK